MCLQRPDRALLSVRTLTPGTKVWARRALDRPEWPAYPTTRKPVAEQEHSSWMFMIRLGSSAGQRFKVQQALKSLSGLDLHPARRVSSVAPEIVYVCESVGVAASALNRSNCGLSLSKNSMNRGSFRSLLRFGSRSNQLRLG
jgi:hypothetical protein